MCTKFFGTGKEKQRDDMFLVLSIVSTLFGLDLKAVVCPKLFWIVTHFAHHRGPGWANYLIKAINSRINQKIFDDGVQLLALKKKKKIIVTWGQIKMREKNRPAKRAEIFFGSHLVFVSKILVLNFPVGFSLPHKKELITQWGNLPLVWEPLL